VEARYDPAAKTVRCLVCPVQDVDLSEQPVDFGVAGGSARREFERRAAKRKARVTGRFGNRLGSVIVALTTEPQTTSAWASGARGEERLAETLARIPGLSVLNDRCMPGTRANIDHIVVGPGGVFVIDAKHHRGRISIHNKGGLFRTDLRLYVGRRDCSALADKVDWQAKTVERALRSAGLEAVPPIVSVLCFIDGDWPLISPPRSYRGVRLEGTHSIQKLVTGASLLDEPAIERLTRILATALPAK
jgi:hypothetical protein